MKGTRRARIDLDDAVAVRSRFSDPKRLPELGMIQWGIIGGTVFCFMSLSQGLGVYISPDHFGPQHTPRENFGAYLTDTMPDYAITSTITSTVGSAAYFYFVRARNNQPDIQEMMGIDQAMEIARVFTTLFGSSLLYQIPGDFYLHPNEDDEGSNLAEDQPLYDQQPNSLAIRFLAKPLTVLGGGFIANYLSSAGLWEALSHTHKVICCLPNTSAVRNMRSFAFNGAKGALIWGTAGAFATAAETIHPYIKSGDEGLDRAGHAAVQSVAAGVGAMAGYVMAKSAEQAGQGLRRGVSACVGWLASCAKTKSAQGETDKLLQGQATLYGSTSISTEGGGRAPSLGSLNSLV